MRQSRHNLLADLPEERQQKNSPQSLAGRIESTDFPGSAPSTKVVSDGQLHATAAKGSRSCAATPSSKLVKFLRRHVKRPLPSTKTSRCSLFRRHLFGRDPQARRRSNVLQPLPDRSCWIHALQNAVPKGLARHDSVRGFAGRRVHDSSDSFDFPNWHCRWMFSSRALGKASNAEHACQSWSNIIVQGPPSRPAAPLLDPFLLLCFYTPLSLPFISTSLIAPKSYSLEILAPNSPRKSKPSLEVQRLRRRPCCHRRNPPRDCSDEPATLNTVGEIPYR